MQWKSMPKHLLTLVQQKEDNGRAFDLKVDELCLMQQRSSSSPIAHQEMQKKKLMYLST
jgi:hypothetical protein